MRGVGFGIPVMPHAYAYAYELLEKAGWGVAPGLDFGQAGKRGVRFSYTSSEKNIREAARRPEGTCAAAEEGRRAAESR